MWMEFQLRIDKGAGEDISGLLHVPGVRVIELMFAHAQPPMLLPASPPGYEQTTSVRLGQLQLKRVSSTNRIHSGMAKGVDPEARVAATISHHGFASSYQKQPTRILRFDS